MHAKAPLDVDLEDKLLYGLTPIRLAYLVVALLTAFAIWSSPWAPPAMRLVLALTVVVLGAAGAWGRWKGRAADAWVADISIFVVKTYRVSWEGRRPSGLRRRPSRTQPTLRPQKVNATVLLLSLAAFEDGAVCPPAGGT